MGKALPPGFAPGEDGTWKWAGGGVLGPGQLLKVFGFMSAPVLAGCGIVALLGNARAAGIVLVSVLLIVAMTLLVFARFTAHYRIVQMCGDGQRIRLRFAWGMRRSYPVAHLSNPGNRRCAGCPAASGTPWPGAHRPATSGRRRR